MTALSMTSLSLRLLRLGGPRAWTTAGLVGAGVAVASALLAVALGALHGLDSREARTGWRTPAAAAPGEPVIAQVRTRVDHAAGKPITQVDVVAPGPAAPGPATPGPAVPGATGPGPATPVPSGGTTAPPGLPRLPAPGELWVSPALAALLRELAPDALANRYPGPPTGLIGDAGLRFPDELVVVIGRPAGDPVLTAPGDSRVVPVASFARTTVPAEDEGYRQLTIVAVALVAFPIAGLLGASARLTATRRGERLATLRLLGASTRQITVVAVAETTVIATAAAITGFLLEALVSPLVARIPLAGGGWFAADVRPSVLVSVGAVVAVGLLATASAVGGLRRVVVSPLGVARRQQARGVRLVRLLGVVAALVVFAIGNSALRVVDVEAAGLVMAAVVLALFGAVVLVGPLVVRGVGGWLGRRESVPALLAGRRLQDDPRAAFRPLAGVTLAIFVAGFLAPLSATAWGATQRDDHTLHVRAGTPDQATTLLARAGIGADVRPAAGERSSGVDVRPVDPAELDRARTLLAPLAPGTLVQTDAEASGQNAVLLDDLRRGVLVVLVATFLVAATATGTAAAARVLDHRHTLRLLRLAGTPVRVLEQARMRETAAPLLVNGAIALAFGLLCASPFTAATGVLAPSGLIVLGSVLLAGTAAVLAATAASRPLLRSLTREDQERSL
ncbi:hypothetical protein [Pseudonocardia ailaonensis]|uniref:hypothetical protein n=1 Tax=Pseudonocardia ailaonensis TaxID=367279 RepID=UPI0031D10A9E